MPTFHIRNKKRIRKKSALLFVCLVLLFIDNLNSFCVCFFFLFKNKPFAINQPVRDHIVSVFFWKNVCVLCFFLNYLARFSLLCPVLLCMCLLYIYNNAGEYKNQVFMLMERLYILSFLLFFFIRNLCPRNVQLLATLRFQSVPIRVYSPAADHACLQAKAINLFL